MGEIWREDGVFRGLHRDRVEVQGLNKEIKLVEQTKTYHSATQIQSEVSGFVLRVLAARYEWSRYCPSHGR